MDSYWQRYNECLDRVARYGKTVDAVIGILGTYYPPSSGVAFHPGGADRDLLGTLTDSGWSVVWMEASYHYAIRDPRGSGFTSVEVDLCRGFAKPA